MEQFNIRILKKSPTKSDGEMYQAGRITIGDFTERFWMPLSFWNIGQYRKQWEEGIAYLRTHDSSCLIAKISMEKNELFVSAWVLYKVGDTIFIQYHFYPDKAKVDQLPSFNSKTCYSHLRPRTDKFEEWSVKSDDFFASWHKNKYKK